MKIMESSGNKVRDRRLEVRQLRLSRKSPRKALLIQMKDENVPRKIHSVMENSTALGFSTSTVPVDPVDRENPQNVEAS